MPRNTVEKKMYESRSCFCLESIIHISEMHKSSSHFVLKPMIHISLDAWSDDNPGEKRTDSQLNHLGVLSHAKGAATNTPKKRWGEWGEREANKKVEHILEHQDGTRKARFIVHARFGNYLPWSHASRHLNVWPPNLTGIGLITAIKHCTTQAYHKIIFN